MHSLMLPVLLGAGGLDALMLNTETNPPDIELAETVKPARRKGNTIVCADGSRQPEFAKSPIKLREDAVAFGREQSVTRQ